MMDRQGHLLLIESASLNCSVGIGRNGALTGLREESASSFAHAEKLHLFAEELIEEVGREKELWKAVAVSIGPGSYTGLRIGLSLAKGIAYAFDCPLITLSSLDVLHQTFLLDHPAQQAEVFWPMIDARRMEVYTKCLQSNGRMIREEQAMILEERSPDPAGICFGTGSEKARGLLEAAGCSVFDGPEPSARGMIKLAEESFERAVFADLAYSEPHYLKEFQAGKPKRSKTN